MIALGGMVVNDIENHLDARFVKRLDHLFEFLNLLADLTARGVFIVRRQITDRIVAPVVSQAALEQMRIVNKLMDGHELHCGDAETREIFDRFGMAQAGVGSAQLFRNVRMLFRKTFDVHFVNYRLTAIGSADGGRCPSRNKDWSPRDLGMKGALSASLRGPSGSSKEVREDRFIPIHLAFNRPRIGIEQQFRRTTAMPSPGAQGP